MESPIRTLRTLPLCPVTSFPKGWKVLSVPAIFTLPSKAREQRARRYFHPSEQSEGERARRVKKMTQCVIFSQSGKKSVISTRGEASIAAVGGRGGFSDFDQGRSLDCRRRREWGIFFPCPYEKIRAEQPCEAKLSYAVRHYHLSDSEL